MVVVIEVVVVVGWLCCWLVGWLWSAVGWQGRDVVGPPEGAERILNGFHVFAKWIFEGF